MGLDNQNKTIGATLTQMGQDSIDAEDRVNKARKGGIYSEESKPTSISVQLKIKMTKKKSVKIPSTINDLLTFNNHFQKTLLD
jgi:hypothetical protein